MHVLEDVSRITKQLIIKEPFYGIFSSTLNKVVGTVTPTAGVCKHNINYQLMINEKFWNSLDSDNKKIGLIKHELLHICFNHILEAPNYSNHKLHNIAADIEINQYINPAYYPSSDILLPSTFPDFNLPLKAGTKKYYELLLAQAKQSNILSSDPSKSINSSTANNNSNESSNNSNDNESVKILRDLLSEEDGHITWREFDELSEADKKLIKAQVDHQIKEIVEQSKNRGLVPSELKEYIDSLFEIKEPSYDWRTYFRKFSGSSNKVYTKKTRRKLNKRFIENPALKIKTKKSVLVGIDTSGSVSTENLLEFFSEIYHMHKTGIKITIAECDANVSKVWEYKGKSPEFITGRGGTDMNPIIDYFNQKPIYNSLIILTDGFVGEKTSNMFKPMLMVITKDGESLDNLKTNGWENCIKMLEK